MNAVELVDLFKSEEAVSVVLQLSIAKLDFLFEAVFQIPNSLRPAIPHYQILQRFSL